MNRYPKLIARITNEPASLREICLILMYDLALLVILVVLVAALPACSTMRKAICPPAHVSTVTETEHSFVVSYTAECKEHTQVVAK